MRRLAEYLQSKQSPYVPLITLAITLSPFVLCLVGTVLAVIITSRGSISFVGILCLLSAIALFVAVFPASFVLLRILRQRSLPRE